MSLQQRPQNENYANFFLFKSSFLLLRTTQRSLLRLFSLLHGKKKIFQIFFFFWENVCFCSSWGKLQMFLGIILGGMWRDSHAKSLELNSNLGLFANHRILSATTTRLNTFSLDETKQSQTYSSFTLCTTGNLVNTVCLSISLSLSVSLS